MKRSAQFVFGLLALLFCCSASQGQCATGLNPHFSVYTSVARDGKNIHTSVSISGYTSIPPGCVMTTATHHVGAENKLNGVDHWSYSPNGCPTCYMAISNYEAIVGVPGVLYPFSFDGTSICSIIGQIYNSGGGGSLPGCVTPSTETTRDGGYNGSISREQFTMTLNDSAGDSFDSSAQVPNIQEATAVTPQGTNSCYFSTGPLVQHPGVSGGSWSVGTPGHNQWGPDNIGANLSDIATVVKFGPAHGITFPCTLTIYQVMDINCAAGLWLPYHSDTIIIQIEADETQEVCRDGEGTCD